MLAAGLICGIAASVLFNLGIALQALEARSAPAGESLQVSLLVTLVRRRRWLAGLLLGALGLPLQVLAFAWRRSSSSSRCSPAACWCCWRSAAGCSGRARPSTRWSASPRSSSVSA